MGVRALGPWVGEQKPLGKTPSGATPVPSRPTYLPYLVLCGVACCVWVFAVGPGCPLLSPGGSWCRVSVVVAVWFGVVYLVVPLPYVVFCGAVLLCGGGVLCSAVCLHCCLCQLFVSCCLASAVCVLRCRALPSLSSPPCAVLCCAVLVPLRCAVRVICAVSGAWCCWFLVSLPVFGVPVVALFAWRCRLVVCVRFGVRVWPGRRSASSL